MQGGVFVELGKWARVHWILVRTQRDTGQSTSVYVLVLQLQLNIMTIEDHIVATGTCVLTLSVSIRLYQHSTKGELGFFR